MDTFGAVGFWIFIAAIVVGGMWKEEREKAEKHETMRRLVEKTGSIDEARLKELFNESNFEGKLGGTYRGLRIAGTIVMFAGAAMALFFLATLLFGHPVEWWYGGVAVAAGVSLVGFGVFTSSRFAEPPPGNKNESSAR